jgi:hypothetical protein
VFGGPLILVMPILGSHMDLDQLEYKATTLLYATVATSQPRFYLEPTLDFELDIIDESVTVTMNPLEG